MTPTRQKLSIDEHGSAISTSTTLLSEPTYPSSEEDHALGQTETGTQSTHQHPRGPESGDRGLSNAIDPENFYDVFIDAGQEVAPTPIWTNEDGRDSLRLLLGEPESSSALPTTSFGTANAQPVGADTQESLLTTQRPSNEIVTGSLPSSHDALPLYKRLARLQDKYFTLHTQLESERRDVPPLLKYLDESISDFMQTEQQGHMLDTDRSNTDLRKKAYDQLIEDRKAFESKMKAVDDHERRLSKLEYTIGKLQAELLRILASHFRSVGDEADEDTASAHSCVSFQSPTLHPLEDEYNVLYEDVQQLQNQLANHVADFQDPSNDDNALDDGDTEDARPYSEWWRDKYRVIWDDLRGAEEDLRELWHRCRAEGLEVEELRLEIPEIPETSRPPNESETLVASDVKSDALSLWPNNRQDTLPGFLQGLNWTKAGGRIASCVDEIIQSTAKNNFIKNWVGNMPSEPVEFQHDFFYTQSEPDWDFVNRKGDDVAPLNDFHWTPHDDRMAFNARSLGTRDREASSTAVHQLRGVRSDSALQAKARSPSATLSPPHVFHRRSHDPTR